MRILSEAHYPELPNYYRGKVRENYDLPDGSRIIISTDRLSAFGPASLSRLEAGRSDAALSAGNLRQAGIGQVAIHDAAGSDNGTIADRDTGQDNSARADPHVVADSNSRTGRLIMFVKNAFRDRKVGDRARMMVV